MGPQELLRLLWRRKLAALGVALLVIGGAAAFVSRQPKVYESTATVALLPDRDGDADTIAYFPTFVATLLPTYSARFDSLSFNADVAEALPFEASAEEVSGSVFAEPVSDIGVLKVKARTSDPERAAAFAQASAEQFVVGIGDDPYVDLEIIDEARAETAPIAPRPALVLSMAIVVGLALGVGAALAWERLFGRVNTAAELTEASGVPVLGVLPIERRLKVGRRIVVGEPDLVEIEEALRVIRTNLLFATAGNERGPIMISGLNPGDGKSTVTSNLAVITAELGFSVLLIDADVHRPVQHEIFDLDNFKGVTSTVLTAAEPVELVQKTEFTNLSVVTSGPPLSSRARELTVYLQHLPRFTTLAEIVLIDSPPLRAADDVRLLAAFAGAVVLLIRAGSASHRQVRQAVESMQVLGANVIGTVLTMSNESTTKGAGSYYRYRRFDGPEVPNA